MLLSPNPDACITLFRRLIPFLARFHSLAWRLASSFKITATTAGVICLAEDVEGLDDYTAPNETGTPSPAPALPTTGRASSGGLLLRSTPAHFAPAGAHRSGEALVEYSVPPLTGGGGGGGHLKMTPPIAPVAATAAVAVAPTWKHPPYERIVRGVECIIVRIRALLDVSCQARSFFFIIN